MELWKGSLAPFRKHISSVAYVPLESMTKEDWDVLDFPDLRPQARARLIRQVERGTLRGFFRVRFDMHKRSHGGKPVYYYPATDEQIDAFENGEFENARFENFDDYEQEAAESERFERGYDILFYAPTVAILAARIINSANEQYQEYLAGLEDAPEWAIPIVVLSVLYASPESELLAIADEFGIPADELQGLDRYGIIDLILEAIDEAVEDRLDV